MDYELYVPDGGDRKPLLIALHGYGGTAASMMRTAQLINDHDFVIVSLQGPHQHIAFPETGTTPLKFGFGWVTNYRPEESIALHHNAINSIITDPAVTAVADAGTLFLLGFSQSVAINFRYAFSHPGRVRGIIALCGGIPGDWTTSEKYTNAATSVLYIAGSRDTVYPPATIARHAEALRSRTNDVAMQEINAGHEITGEMLSAVRSWLARQCPSP